VERNRIEGLTKKLKATSNYFQMSKVGLTKPRNLRNDGNTIIWDNAFAGDTPVKSYEICCCEADRKNSKRYSD